jgi:NAD(P)H-dependent FMN reductase
MTTQKQKHSELTFTYELFYNEYFSDRITKFEDAISRAKYIIKANPESKGGFTIVLNNTIIAAY